MLPDDQKIADELNTFFKNAVSNLNINENTYIINHNSGNLSDPVDKAICKYKFHPSILLIKSKLENQKLFSFQPISKFDMEKDIQNIDLNKATTKNTIPPKILKVSSNTFAESLRNLFNECLITGNFPDNLKLADITPVFKKKDTLNKENCRPVSVLPSISKIFSTQLALISLIEKWKKASDHKDFGGAVLMDLFKVFDTVNRDLLIAKLHAYSFDKNSLKLLLSF